MKRVTEITIEVERVRVTRKSRRRFAGWCRECRAEVEFASSSEAAALLNLEIDDIFRLIKSKKVHTAAIGDKVIIICLNSLFSLEKVIDLNENDYCMGDT
jgi:hypothetical protein